MIKHYISKDGDRQTLSLFTQYKKGDLVDNDFLIRLNEAYPIVVAQYSETDPHISYGFGEDRMSKVYLIDGWWYGIREGDNQLYTMSPVAMVLYFVQADKSAD